MVTGRREEEAAHAIHGHVVRRNQKSQHLVVDNVGPRVTRGAQRQLVRARLRGIENGLILQRGRRTDKIKIKKAGNSKNAQPTRAKYRANSSKRIRLHKSIQLMLPTPPCRSNLSMNTCYVHRGILLPPDVSSTPLLKIPFENTPKADIKCSSFT
jgi:hypothetical protein